ncbi:hypothetical protein BGX16_0520 [Hallerella succinigenes]|uniref:Uncharacterized protein n=2 Tax=Fibrobacteraceae TaxID=204431 RepID=A0A2M9A4G8_9BACT|nr:hypothetical protein BGX16_0520 [Hallerella succinigenes]
MAKYNNIRPFNVFFSIFIPFCSLPFQIFPFVYYVLLSVVTYRDTMKKVILIVCALLAIQVWAQSSTGFAGINFGLNRESVIEEIMKLGYDPLGSADGADRVVIPVYMMDELPVQVDFLFNKNDHFYAFEVRTGRMEVDRLPKVFEALEYMSDRFVDRYGKKVRTTELQEADIKPSVHNLYKQWTNHKSLNIYTAIIYKDGRYYTVGSVTNRKLAKEQSKSKSKKHDFSDMMPN